MAIKSKTNVLTLGIVVLCIVLTTPLVWLTLDWFLRMGEITNHPIYSTPVKLENKGIVAEMHFKAENAGRYALVLRFNFNKGDEIDRKRAETLLAEKNLVKVRLFRVEADTEAELFHVEKQLVQISTQSSSFFEKAIFSTRLGAGNYRVTLENLSPSPDFAQQPIKLIFYRQR